VRDELAATSDELLLGYVGGLHESRDLKTLISAFERVSGPPARLVIIGDGRDRVNLENHAASLGLSDVVTFTGSVSHSKVPSYLAALDVGLSWIPDRPQYRNQPPLKTVEYLAAGLPVIATPTPGNLEFCTDRNAIISSFDIDSFASDLKQLVGDEELRQSIAQNAIESVAEYDYDTIVKKHLIPIYKKAISKCSTSELSATKFYDF
jgi:glycosyltransferase involved in cell wall biosynthesis